ncbi:MAG: SRPBCC family protein [Actinobacteria bacterium]|nr:SRPBCC family protein [Actinomycetota bacterium]
MVEQSIDIAASAQSIMAALADLPAVASWVDGTSVEVLQVHDDGRPARARWSESYGPIPDEFILDYDWKGDESCHWRLVEGRILQREDGSYTLTEVNERVTRVTYSLDLGLAIPLPSIVTDQIASSVVTAGLAALKNNVEAT